jgi:hypothetical protein
MPSYPIIHINGFPGMGKLTIARKLVDLLSRYDAKLVHNHLLIDPVGAILPRSSTDYQPVRRALQSVIFNALATSKDTAKSIYVFTDFQSCDEIGCGVMSEYREMVERRGCGFVPIILTCSKEENLRRLSSMERARHGKLTDTELGVYLRDSSKVYHGHEHDPYHMELDITDLEADAAAQLICAHVLGVCRTLRLE